MVFLVVQREAMGSLKRDGGKSERHLYMIQILERMFKCLRECSVIPKDSDSVPCIQQHFHSVFRNLLKILSAHPEADEMFNMFAREMELWQQQAISDAMDPAKTAAFMAQRIPLGAGMALSFTFKILSFGRSVMYGVLLKEASKYLYQDRVLNVYVKLLGNSSDAIIEGKNSDFVLLQHAAELFFMRSELVNSYRDALSWPEKSPSNEALRSARFEYYISLIANSLHKYRKHLEKLRDLSEHEMIYKIYSLELLLSLCARNFVDDPIATRELRILGAKSRGNRDCNIKIRILYVNVLLDICIRGSFDVLLFYGKAIDELAKMVRKLREDAIAGNKNSFKGYASIIGRMFTVDHGTPMRTIFDNEADSLRKLAGRAISSSPGGPLARPLPSETERTPKRRARANALFEKTFVATSIRNSRIRSIGFQ
jgi:hypothetical protein